MQTMIAEVKRAVLDLAESADHFENKHLRDILKDAAGRLHDAENHPDAASKPAPDMLFVPEGAQTGEPNPTLG